MALGPRFDPVLHHSINLKNRRQVVVVVSVIGKFLRVKMSNYFSSNIRVIIRKDVSLLQTSALVSTSFGLAYYLRLIKHNQGWSMLIV